MTKPHRILVFCDDLYHPAATVRAGLAPLAADGLFSFDWVENAAGWDPGQLAGYGTVLLSKSNVCSATDRTPWLAGETETVLGDFVRAGGGLLAVHSGTAGYKDVPGVRAVLGGVFDHHPPPGPVTVEPGDGHPLGSGVGGAFTIHDEHYQMIRDDPAADVFLHTRSAHGVQPAGWTRHEGAGRVAVLTPGHFPEVWLHAGMQRLLANCLRWVAPGAGSQPRAATVR
jgi:type 1 glutamine amidotransferase